MATQTSNSQKVHRPGRSDRLFDLIVLLRDGRLHRAEDLARDLNVSVRTIYRDMDTLA
ncbi:MAG: HTH domain-containing protein, partial [Litoreibacter sp.]|nr:HTH domain-containing protein [Litoreibacter sp.]